MRPMALANNAPPGTDKPTSAAVCENQTSPNYAQVLLDAYDAGKWLELDQCRSCPVYAAVRP